MKAILRLSISITIIILIPIIVLAIPINHVEMQINTTNGPKQELVKDQVTQIYVDSYPESPGWIVCGKDCVIFKDDNKKDNIFIVGNFPKKMNYDLININTFVLNGKYIGKKRRNGVIAECFYVESWGILGKIGRKNSCFDSFSKSSLTVADKIFEDPILVYDLDEFEDVDYSEALK
ncbi:hypothetical protein [Clostridium beijerinckii]|uniref:Uncharacterized protein n=1 Tax=Clostridium beijerinckii TaxID=1520 RepID=A0AAX0B9S0_CLOBE|nr:hypothetical protein [Clostridium beijerinckii]NRT91278.1 hypothetical protein [Clostridium beijerinckii]NYC70804.1 hypothetical protein [Clostridium beijerinckii]